MGKHRSHKVALVDNSIPLEPPPWPNNIGKERKLKSIDGQTVHFEVEDEIILPQSTTENKLIVFQKIHFLVLLRHIIVYFEVAHVIFSTHDNRNYMSWH
jgi:hypothetical protein